MMRTRIRIRLKENHRRINIKIIIQIGRKKNYYNNNNNNNNKNNNTNWKKVITIIK